MSLGIYITIEKQRENENSVEYRYGPDKKDFGLVSISKATGEVSLVTPSSVEPPDQRYFLRVKEKLRRHWAAGELPAKTWWAS